MIVTWTTINFINMSVVEFGEDSLHLAKFGTQKSFMHGLIYGRKTTMHTVVLTGLQPGTKYSKFLINLLNL